MEDESNSSGTDSNGDRKVIKSEARLRIGGGEASLVKVLIAKRAAMMDPGPFRLCADGRRGLRGSAILGTGGA